MAGQVMLGLKLGPVLGVTAVVVVVGFTTW